MRRYGGKEPKMTKDTALVSWRFNDFKVRRKFLSKFRMKTHPKGFESPIRNKLLKQVKKKD